MAPELSKGESAQKGRHKVVVKHRDAAHASPLVNPLTTKHRNMKTRMIFLHSSLVFLLIAAGLSVFLMLKQKTIRRAQLTAYALQTSQSAVARCCAELKTAETGLREMRAAVALWLQEGRDAANAMASSPAAQPADKASASDNAASVEAPAAPVRPEAGATSPPVAAANVDEAGRERPYGMPSAAELEALRRKNDKAAAERPLPVASDAPAVARPEPAAVSAAQSPHQEALRSLNAHAAAIDDHLKTVEAFSQDGLRVAEEVLRTSLPNEAEACAEKARKMVESAEQELAAARVEHKGASDRVEELRTLKARFLAAKEEVRSQAEEAAKKEAQAALIRRELEEVATAHQGVKELFKQFLFQEAAARLDGALGGLKTEEGRQALQCQVERFQILQQFKEYLIKGINEDPLRWGWGTGMAARDILGASETGFRLRGAQATWPEVNVAQMQRFLDYYLTARKLERPQLARQAVAAAVYFSELGRPDLVDPYIGKASAADLTAKKLADRLLPRK